MLALGSKSFTAVTTKACLVNHVILTSFITFGGHSAHLAYHVQKVAIKHQSSSDSVTLICVILKAEMLSVKTSVPPFQHLFLICVGSLGVILQHT